MATRDRDETVALSRAKIAQDRDERIEQTQVAAVVLAHVHDQEPGPQAVDRAPEPRGGLRE